jgi:hypothetical protein
MAYPAETTLYIEGVDAQGHLSNIGTFNISNTNGLRDYSLETVFYSGLRAPNTLLFLTNTNSGSYVLMENITFGK